MPSLEIRGWLAAAWSAVTRQARPPDGRGEPYVIVRDERNQIAVNVREAEVSG